MCTYFMNISSQANNLNIEQNKEVGIRKSYITVATCKKWSLEFLIRLSSKKAPVMFCRFSLECKFEFPWWDILNQILYAACQSRNSSIISKSNLKNLIRHQFNWLWVLSVGISFLVKGATSWDTFALNWMHLGMIMKEKRYQF